MTMLKKLALKNFQCHSDLVVDLDERITTIVGPSDVGKSAIIRALKWIVTNKPAGDAFRKDGTKKTSVGLLFDDKRLSRSKSASSNKMKLEDKTFAAFGADIPEEILEALNISHLSFQNQHDSPFWFSETAGQVGRELNAIVNLDVIDRTLKNVASALRTARAEEDASRSRAEDASKEVEELAFVEELEQEFKRLESKEASLTEIVSRLAQIEQDVGDALEFAKTARRLREAYRDGKGVVSKWGVAQDTEQRLQVLVDVVDRAEEYQAKASERTPSEEEVVVVEKDREKWQVAKEKHAKLEALVWKAESQKNAAQAIEVPELEELSKLEEIGKELWDLVRYGRNLVAFTEMVEGQRDKCASLQNGIETAEKELHEKLEGTCPVCGGEWND